MAEIQIQPGQKHTLTASNLYVLGDASDDTVGSWLVHLVDGGSFSGSVQPQSRIRIPIAQAGTTTIAPTGGGGTNDDVTPVTVAYFDETQGTYTTAAISSVPALITLRASGMVVALNVTVNAGSLLVYATKVFGASA